MIINPSLAKQVRGILFLCNLHTRTCEASTGGAVARLCTHRALQVPSRTIKNSCGTHCVEEKPRETGLARLRAELWRGSDVPPARHSLPRPSSPVSNNKNSHSTRSVLWEFWCGKRDLNPYGVHHTPLKRARLPVPPLPRTRGIIS